jgi:hypothetical protein
MSDDEISLEILRDAVRTPEGSVGPEQREISADEIGPEAIALWRRLNAIIDEGAHKHWEPNGRQREYHDACVRLHSVLLGLDPWQWEAIDADDPEPPATMTESWRRADYARAHRLYKLLEAAAAAANRADS